MVLTEVGARGRAARRATCSPAARDLVDFARHRGRLLTGRLHARRDSDARALCAAADSAARCSARYPELQLELRETQTGMLIDELARGALDVVMLALPVDEADIETLPLFDDPFLLAVPAARSAPDTRARRRARHRPAAG